MAKFYYSKSKMVWETIQEGLKSKMEIKCSDICALKITFPKNLPGMLDITVRERVLKIIMLMSADNVVW